MVRYTEIMRGRSLLWASVFAIGLTIVLAAAAIWWVRVPRPVRLSPDSRLAAARAFIGTREGGRPRGDESGGAAPRDTAHERTSGATDEDPMEALEDSAGDWERVDMEEIRTAMPDTLYWKMAAPTQDPEVLRAREEERARWNTEYGKVLSNTATAEEIDAFYAQQQRISEDYLEFLVYLGSHYAEVIPSKDVGLLKLAGELHLARLEEIPRRITEAQERREAHDAARRAWLEEQKKFDE